MLLNREEVLDASPLQVVRSSGQNLGEAGKLVVDGHVRLQG